MMKILGLCGSLDVGSNTMRALKMAVEGARVSGARIEIVDLRNYEIPILNHPHQSPASLRDVKKMKKKCRQADGFIFATPEYHGSFSGALKNALDWMGFDEFEGKMIGLVGLAGGDTGAFNAINHLRTVCRQIHAWVVPGQVSIANSHQVFDKDGQLKDPKLAKRLENLGREVAKFTLLHKQGKSTAFLKLWNEYVANPGGAGR